MYSLQRLSIDDVSYFKKTDKDPKIARLQSMQNYLTTLIKGHEIPESEKKVMRQTQIAKALGLL